MSVQGLVVILPGLFIIRLTHSLYSILSSPDKKPSTDRFRLPASVFSRKTLNPCFLRSGLGKGPIQVQNIVPHRTLKAQAFELLDLFLDRRFDFLRAQIAGAGRVRLQQHQTIPVPKFADGFPDRPQSGLGILEKGVEIDLIDD